MSMKLVPFSDEHIAILNTWVKDEDLLFQFSGNVFRIPFTIEQFINYSLIYPDRKFYIAYQSNEPVGFGEIIPQETGIPRLGRVLIGNSASRMKGLGKELVRLLIERCVEDCETEYVELYVWHNNDAAIKCYSSVGFNFIPSPQLEVEHNGVKHQLKKMRLKLY